MAFTILGYLEAHFEIRFSGDFAVLRRCVFCDGIWKLHINVRSERTWGWCFRCSTHTDAVKLVMAHRGLERFQAIEFIKRGEYGESLATQLQKVQPRPKPKLPAQILPSEFARVKFEPSEPVERMALAYLRKRGVTDVQIVHHGIGYCSTGHYFGCIVVPVTKDGAVAYFVARAFMRPGIKYLNPPKEVVGTGKSEVIFNYDTARNSGDGVLCEGVFDAMAMGGRGMAMLGKRLSDEQAAMLLAFKRVGVCLDDDANRERLETVEQLRAFGIDAYPVHPLGHDPSDAGGKVEIGEASFRDLIVERMRGGA